MLDNRCENMPEEFWAEALYNCGVPRDFEGVEALKSRAYEKGHDSGEDGIIEALEDLWELISDICPSATKPRSTASP